MQKISPVEGTLKWFSAREAEFEATSLIQKLELELKNLKLTAVTLTLQP